ncbi:RNHCP domain-containing protein [Candidatus Parcubacteria bacterium]|nr:RNHCP domain-containing protein [Candidatus Parcubacteria bacterium]
MPKKFTRKTEDFICKHCNAKVKGTGYTNHCPKCLWSRHVDINPGDRENSCGGMMEPVAVEKNGEELVIIHRCGKCGEKKRNKTVENDNMNAVISLMAGGDSEHS